MVSETFTLIGRTGPIFRVVRFLNVAGIPCVYGRTLNDRLQTTARLEDIAATPDFIATGKAACAFLAKGKAA